MRNQHDVRSPKRWQASRAESGAQVSRLSAVYSEFLNWETTDWQDVARKGTGCLHAEDVQNLVGEDEEEEAALDINLV